MKRLRRVLPFALALVVLAAVFRLGAEIGARNVDLLPLPVRIAAPPLDVPPLTAITGGATEDAAITTAVVAYYEANTAHLRREFREADDARLGALYAMYLVNHAQPYATTSQITTLREFVTADAAHCGTYATAMQLLARALGLRSRITVTGEYHAWLEVEVNGRWELFDPTTSVWVDQPMAALVRGGPRRYRAFHTANDTGLTVLVPMAGVLWHPFDPITEYEVVEPA